jgi:2-oxoisovalerate dehydrogenase E1 component alpha subunit
MFGSQLRVLRFAKRKCFNGLPQTSAFRFFSQSRARLEQTEQEEMPHFPGALKAPYTKELKIVNGLDKTFPVFYVTDYNGDIVNTSYYEEARKHISDDLLVKMYKDMISLNTMDDILYNAQRQGRVSFYMTNYGEEAVQIGSAAALAPSDEIYAQYREAGVLLYRGFTLRQFMNQCFSTAEDLGKGRQMPVHYGSKELHFQTISSPLATQIPQAAGVGYGYRLSNSDNVCMCYFGEGAASEGDFHAALNFAATLNAQTVFLCRNNGYAISTPTKDQYRGDGIVARGIGYGMHSIRVDGNDLFAVYTVVKQAREMSIKNKTPVLIEAMTYRGGHHSTSDDASRYRTVEELEMWIGKYNPILRLRKFLTKNKLWNDDMEQQMREQTRKQVLAMLAEIEHAPKVPLSELVTDVYDTVPKHLQEQKAFVDAMVNKYPEAYESSH